MTSFVQFIPTYFGFWKRNYQG